MECNCKSLEIVLAVVIFIVSVWPELLGEMASRWVMAISAFILVAHALMCRLCACGVCTMCREKMNYQGRKKIRR